MWFTRRKIAATILPLAALAVSGLIADAWFYSRRPSNVPDTATWYDGGKGWRYWIDCSPSSKGEPNACTLFLPRTGQIASKISVVVEGEQRGAVASELQIASFNGSRIELKNGKRLVPANAADHF